MPCNGCQVIPRRKDSDWGGGGLQQGEDAYQGSLMVLGGNIGGYQD